MTLRRCTWRMRFFRPVSRRASIIRWSISSSLRQKRIEFRGAGGRGSLLLTAVLSEGKKTEEAEKSLLAEIKKLQDAPVSAAELEKAKNQLITKPTAST